SVRVFLWEEQGSLIVLISLFPYNCKGNIFYLYPHLFATEPEKPISKMNAHKCEQSVRPVDEVSGRVIGYKKKNQYHH
ncbi:MAG: hypothetical protein SPF09_07375, partial [Bacteroidaceae bacterium]|nr:hypothetical protein [Bacteroidaceae bacterium]